MKAEDLPDLSPREDRRAGAVLGLAAGDSLGATHEFRRPKDVPEGPLEIVGGGVFRWEPGAPTDDTELALAVLEGYRSGELDLGAVRDAMLRWQEGDPRDIGNQTALALGYLRRHSEALSLPDKPEAQGNGTVMRAAPHGVMTRSPKEAFEYAFREAALTHPSWEPQTSAALVACTVAHLVEGASPKEALEAAYSLAEDRAPGKDAARPRAGGRVPPRARGLDRLHHPPRPQGLARRRRVPSGVERVVRLAGDADTNGAVAGGLLGARFGAREIPQGWLERIESAERLLGRL